MFTDRRFELIPEIATLGESGYPGLNRASLRSVFAPRSVSAGIVGTLRKAFPAAVSNPEHVRAMHAYGLGLRMMDDDWLADFSERQRRQYRHLLPDEGADWTAASRKKPRRTPGFRPPRRRGALSAGETWVGKRGGDG